MKKLFKEGNPGKKPGTKNKLTKDLKEIYGKFIQNDKLADSDFIKLSPMQRWRVRLELLGYWFPKLRSIEITTDPISLLTESQSEQIFKQVSDEIMKKVYGDKLND